MSANLKMKKLFVIFGILGILGSFASLYAAGRGNEVMVVYNTRLAESKSVAKHYAEVRQVPDEQVIGFDLPTNEEISRTDFHNRLEKPLVQALVQKKLLHFGSESVKGADGNPQRINGKVTDAKIRYLVLCYGVPLKIAEDPHMKEAGAEQTRIELRRNGAAVDNELACLPLIEQHRPITGPMNNIFLGSTNAASLNPTNGLLLVARLDGPTAAIARSLVDKAIEAETNGLWGRAYFDLRGLANGEYKLGDDWIRGASEVSRRLGFETIVDTNGGTFPTTFPLSQVALYAGWYDENVSGPFARPTVEFMPGAFAYHLHSFSAATLRSETHQWAGPLLARGATATMGTVDEPYLAGTPDMAIFFARFIFSGFTFGEAAYACQTTLSWQTTVVGDPLYRPFAKGPQEQYDELEHRHSKLIEWYYLRATNFKLINGTPLAEMVSAMEKLETAKKSAVLMEKLADMYTAQGKPASSAHALQEALKLDPSPQQRIRIMLTLADHLIPLHQEQEAYEVYLQFMKQFPDYADQLAIYKQLLSLAEKLGKKSEAASHQKEIDRLTSSRNQPPKIPALRRGI
ncbi:MAG: hypothetical protein JWQ71_942 [Pedosphaera sp.]|nr:hypothetical protein [Pedosphaera sp.]